MFAAWAAFAVLWPKSSANPIVAAAAPELGLSIDACKPTLPADRPLMDAACDRIVCMMAGSDRFFGVEHEIEMFKAAGKPVISAEPKVVPAAFAA